MAVFGKHAVDYPAAQHARVKMPVFIIYIFNEQFKRFRLFLFREQTVIYRHCLTRLSAAFNLARFFV